MKITATKRATFEAAHYLTGYDGACANIHGHSYTVEVTVERTDDPLVREPTAQDYGMVYDLKALGADMQGTIMDLDHALLVGGGVVPNFDLLKGITGMPERWKVIDIGGRPTAENIARYIFNRVGDLVDNVLPGKDNSGVRVVKVRVQETSTSWVEVER